MSAELTAEQVRQWLEYNPDTGSLVWLATPNAPNLIRLKVGTEAGTIHGHGYRHVRLHHRMYLAHRLAWLIYYGTWPHGYIDHINGNRLDNRIANLREATRALHSQNRVARGTKRNGNGWTAAIRVNQKRLHLGTFPTEAEAHAAYVEAKRKYHVGFVEARYVG